MIMKKLLFALLFTPIMASAQYSNYYLVDSKVDATVDHNINVNQNINANININKDVNVSGTVSTIDYGQLAAANAQREANRIASMQYADLREREIAISIANDPSKGYDYGTDNNWKLPNKYRKALGWGQGTNMYYHKSPHEALFMQISADDGYAYENKSIEGVKTEILLSTPIRLDKLLEYNPEFNIDIENELEYNDLKIGQLNDLGVGQEVMLHQKDLKRATVAGHRGFKGTLIWEDKYEKCITDNYAAIGEVNGENYLFTCKIRFKGDTDRVSFEDLEGRRFYLDSFIYKTISTVKIF